MKTNNELKTIFNQTTIKPKAELAIDDEKAVIYLYGPIVEEVPVNWFTGEPEKGDYIVPDDLREMFDEIGSDKPVDIHLNSRGGDVYASVAIGNFLKDKANQLNIYIDAIAASGASIIAMSADNLYMYSNSLMMIHRASTIAYGNTEDFEKIANDLKKFDEVVLNSYTGRFKGSIDELKAMLTDETFLTAPECLALGLTDEVIENKTKMEKEVTEDVKVSLLQKYKIEQKNILNTFKGEN